MKKIKQTLAILLSVALVASVAVFSSSAENSALSDFSDAHKAILSGVKDINDPQGCIDFVTGTNSQEVENAYLAFCNLSDDDKAALPNDYGEDIANKLEAAYRRAMVFLYGTYFYDDVKDAELGKYLVNTSDNYLPATKLPVVAQWSPKYSAFRTAVRNDGAIPTTYIKKSPLANTSGYSLGAMRDAVFTIPVAESDTTVQTGVIGHPLWGTGEVALSGTAPIYLRTTDLYLLKWNGKSGNNYNAAYGSAICSLTPWSTTKLTLAESTDSEMKGWVTKIGLNSSATEGKYYYSYDVYGLVDTAQHFSYNDKGTTFAAADITENLNFIFVETQDGKGINVDSIYINYDEGDNSNYADVIKAYLNNVNYADMTAEDIAKIGEYKKFVDYTADYATSANDFTDEEKTKLDGLVKLAEYLKANGKTGISTPADIDGIADEITAGDVAAVTAIYNEYVSLSDASGLNLGDIFTDAQKAKIANAYAIAINLGDKQSYKISTVTGLIDEIDAKYAEKVYNSIAYSVELNVLEAKFNSVKNDGFDSLITNSAKLTALRDTYNALVESGEYSSVADVKFSEYSKKVSNTATSYLPDVDTSNGIDELDITVTRGKTVYFNYSDCENHSGYANAFGINANDGSIADGICFSMTGSYDYGNTTKIPQDFYGQGATFRVHNGTKTWKESGVWHSDPILPAHIASSYMLCYPNADFCNDTENFLSTNYGINEYVTTRGNELRPKEIKEWLGKNSYSNVYFKAGSNVNFNFKYMGDENTLKGYNYYLVTVKGNMVVSNSTGATSDLPADNGVISVDSNGLATVYAVILSDGRFTSFGTTEGTNVKLNSLKINNVPTKLTKGASVRLASGNTSGIRFESTVDLSLYNRMIALVGKENVKLGTLIVPNDYLNDGTEFTVDALKAAGKKYLDIAKTEDKWQDEAKGIYTAAMVNIKEGNFAREFAARGYMKVTVNGVEQIFYSSFSPTSNVRSVHYVAEAALNAYNQNQGPQYTNAELTVLKRFAGRP